MLENIKWEIPWIWILLSAKNGYTNAGEMVNGTLTRRVELPQSYFNKANSIFAEIKNEANIALESQRRALIYVENIKIKSAKIVLK